MSSYLAHPLVTIATYLDICFNGSLLQESSERAEYIIVIAAIDRSLKCLFLDLLINQVLPSASVKVLARHPVLLQYTLLIV